MDPQHLLQLQERAQRLMQVSSQESESGIEAISERLKQIIGRLHATANPNSSEPEALNQYMDLMEQNRDLKKELERQTGRGERMSEQIKRLSAENRELVQTLEHRQTGDRLCPTNQYTQEIRELRDCLQQSHIKCDRLEEMFKVEKHKCHRLSSFIRQKLPKMQEDMAVLSGKLQAKLQQHYLSDM